MGKGADHPEWILEPHLVVDVIVFRHVLVVAFTVLIGDQLTAEKRG